MLGKIARKIFGSANDRFVKKLYKTVNQINALETDFIKLSDELMMQDYAQKAHGCIILFYQF